MRKGTSKYGHQAQKHWRQTCSTSGPELGSAPILPSPHSAKNTKKQSRRMAHEAAAQDPSSGDSPTASLEQENTQDAITRPIMEAIDESKAAVMVSIDHLATECILIWHDLDKIQGWLTVAEDRITEVEDASHSHGNQLSELHDMVKMLQNRADDAEDRQRRNNVREWWGCQKGLSLPRLLNSSSNSSKHGGISLPLMWLTSPCEFPRPFFVRTTGTRT